MNDDDDDVGTGPFQPVYVFLAAMIAGCILIAVVMLAWPASAHTHDGIVYPGNCCNSAATSPTGDCAPIADQYVTAEPDGYHINLPVGAHPKLKKHGYSGIVPYKDAKPPLDQSYHICLAVDGAARFCFFAQPGGV